MLEDSAKSNKKSVLSHIQPITQDFHAITIKAFLTGMLEKRRVLVN